MGTLPKYLLSFGFLFYGIVSANRCTFEEGDVCPLWDYSSPFLVSNASVVTSLMKSAGKSDLYPRVAEKLLLAHCQNSLNQATMILRSAWFNGSGSSCTFAFDLVVVQPASMEAVEVVLQRPGSRDHVLWTIADEAGSRQSEWRHHRVFIGEIMGLFRILVEASCLAATPQSVGPVFGFDNFHLEDCFSGVHRTTSCLTEELSCKPTRTCLSSDVICDNTNDCPDGIDEASVCDALPEGGRCAFETNNCGWHPLIIQPQLDITLLTENIWLRTVASSFSQVQSDRTTGSSSGHFLLLRLPVEQKHVDITAAQLRSPVFARIPMYPANRTKNACKIRFYYLSSGLSEGSLILTAHDADLQPAGRRQELLWKSRYRSNQNDKMNTQWKRASVPIPDFKSTYFLRFVGVGGTRPGYFALDDISLSRSCFFPNQPSERWLPEIRKEENSSQDIIQGNVAAPMEIQFQKEFSVTSCGQVGPDGPYSQDCAPIQASNKDLIKSDPMMEDLPRGVQQWRVLVTGSYNITAFGAAGGSRSSITEKCPGSIVSGIVNLRSGDILYFMIGQMGDNACAGVCNSMESSCSLTGAGGGGGTFVFHKTKDEAIALLTAGGGSGYDTQNISSESEVHLFPSDQVLKVLAETGSEKQKTLQFSQKAQELWLTLKNIVGETKDCPDSNDYTRRAGGFGGGQPGCGRSGGDGGGFNAKQVNSGGQWPGCHLGRPFIHQQQVSTGKIWHGNLVSGRVTVFILCNNCSVNCVLRDTDGVREYICPKSDELLNYHTKSHLQFYLAAIFFGITAVGIVICLFMGTRKRSSKCIKRMHLNGRLTCLASDSVDDSVPPNLTSNENNQLYEMNAVRKFDDLYQIPKKFIQLKKPLGQGAFGVVYEGTMETGSGVVRVAVKTLLEGSNSEADMEFASEALIVSQFHHPNIVQCYGVSFQESPKYIVLELLFGGDVRSFLRLCRSPEHIASKITMLELLEIAVDVAKGCQYLEQYHFVHRDIAARNCLLTSLERNRVAKIADFGMTRDVIKYEYYRKNSPMLLPVKWMPPEAIHGGLYTTKSDMWAFGVFLWEVFSLGCTPYASLTNQEVVTYVGDGGRLSSPSKHCPLEILSLTQRCWATCPADRPGFSTIIQELLGFMGISSVMNAKIPDETAPPIALNPKPPLNEYSSNTPIESVKGQAAPEKMIGSNGTLSVETYDRNSADCHSGSQLLPGSFS